MFASSAACQRPCHASATALISQALPSSGSAATARLVISSSCSISRSRSACKFSQSSLFRVTARPVIAKTRLGSSRSAWSNILRASSVRLHTVGGHRTGNFWRTRPWRAARYPRHLPPAATVRCPDETPRSPTAFRTRRVSTATKPGASCVTCAGSTSRRSLHNCVALRGIDELRGDHDPLAGAARPHPGRGSGR